MGSVLQFIKHQSDDDGRWIKGKRRFQNVEKEAVELINMITGANIAGNEKDEDSEKAGLPGRLKEKLKHI